MLVTLDHSKNALLLYFYLGENIFSGIFLNLSKKFGFYGIPVKVFPKR
jgi:hypothetical protein